jgi:hypothetical protein
MDDFIVACEILGILAVPIELSDGTRVSEDLVKSKYLEVEIIMQFQGENLKGEPIWSYVQVNGLNVARLMEKMRKNESFNPSAFGCVLASGRGFSPKWWIRDRMATEFGTIDMPMR